MGCGGSTGKDGNSMFNKVKTMAFSMVAKTGGGAGGDQQFDFIKNLIMSKFPQANVKKEVDPNLTEGTFDVMMNGEKIHSQVTDGKIDESNGASLLNKVSSKLMQ